MTERQADALHTAPQGVIGTTIYSGFIQALLQDHNPRLTGAGWYGGPNHLGEAAKMVRNPYVNLAYTSVVDPLLSAFWDIRPVSDQPIDLEIAANTREALFDRLSWQTELRKITRFIQDGIAMVEPIECVVEVSPDRYPNHPGRGRGVAWSAWQERPAYTIYQMFQSPTDAACLDRIVQYSSGSDVEIAGLRTVDARNLLRFTWNQVGSNFTGLAPLRTAWAPWFAMEVYQTLEAIYFERCGTGVPTLKLPKDVSDSDRATAIAMLKDIRSNESAFMLLVNDMDFEFKTANGAVIDLAKAIHQRAMDILYAFGAGHLMLGSGSGAKGGSFALASETRGHHSLSIYAYAKFIADVLNRGMDGWSPIKRHVERNYGPNVRPPVVECRDLPVRDITELLTQLPALRQAGFITPDDVLEDYIRRVEQLPRHDPTTARVQATPADPGSDPGEPDEPGEGDDISPIERQPAEETN